METPGPTLACEETAAIVSGETHRVNNLFKRGYGRTTVIEGKASDESEDKDEGVLVIGSLGGLLVCSDEVIFEIHDCFLDLNYK